VPLAAFTQAEASLVLAAGGTTDPEVVRQAIEWTRGSPLALATVASSGLTAFGPVAEAGILEHLGTVLVDEESAGRHLDALTLAAFARTIDLARVRRVLPDADAEEEIAWLAGRTFVERHGARLAMHDLVAHVLRLDLTAREPELVRDLRRRLRTRTTGASGPAADRSTWRTSWTTRPSAGASARGSAPIGSTGSGQVTRRCCATGCWPGTARTSGTGSPSTSTAHPSASRCCATAATASRGSRSRSRRVTRPPASSRIRSCRSGSPTPVRCLTATPTTPSCGCATNFEEDPEGRAQGLLGLAGFLACRLPHVRRCYLPIAADSPGGLAFSRASGAVHHPELDYVDRGGTTQCHIADFGPAGALGALLAVVYAEVGADATTVLDPVRSDRGRLGPPADAVATVRHVLRHLDDDDVLAASPLAPGGVDQAMAAAAVRDRIARSLDVAFVDQRDGSVDAQLRAVIEQGYLVPGAHHDVAARALYLSRATYFRRLRRAIEPSRAWWLARRRTSPIWVPPQIASHPAAEPRLDHWGPSTASSGRDRPLGPAGRRPTARRSARRDRSR
jgi:hypothetical protein